MPWIDLERTSRKPIAKGYHYAILSEVEEATSQKGNPQLVWRFELDDPEDPDYSRQIAVYTPLTQNTRWKLDMLLDALRAPSAGKADPRDFLHRRVILEIVHEPYGGEERAAVGRMWAADDPNAPRPDWSGSTETLQEGSFPQRAYDDEPKGEWPF